MAGIASGEESHAQPVRRIIGKRLSWLMVNIVLNLLSASVIACFQNTLQAVIVLAVFLPIISDMSGNAGMQAIGVSIRELALGLIRASEHRRVLMKEAVIGLVNGAVLGVQIGVIAWLWKGIPMLGVVVGAALWINTMLAVVIGSSVPLALKRLKLDPAIASGPILTTITDMAGFFLILGLATLALPLLQ